MPFRIGVPWWTSLVLEELEEEEEVSLSVLLENAQVENRSKTLPRIV